MGMDVVELLNKVQWGFPTVTSINFFDYIGYFTHPGQPLLLLVGIILVISVAIFTFLSKRLEKKRLQEKQNYASSTSRFRKRDKALFYGRKMLRQMKNISGQVRNSGQGKKRKMVMRFAKKLLQIRKEGEGEHLKVLEPPVEYLEESRIDERMPPDLVYLLQSIRVFGNFDKPVFLKLCRYTTILKVHNGEYLFKLGDMDENIFIVQSGKLSVYTTMADGQPVPLKTVKEGESLGSLLSFIDCHTGNMRPYKSISAKATEDTVVVKLPMIKFSEIFDENPEILIRVIQVIMVRLHRVTFTTLHDYLGLSSELMNSAASKGKRGSIMHMSPSRKIRSDERTIHLEDIKSHSEVIAIPDMIPGKDRREDHEHFRHQPDKDEDYFGMAVAAFEKELGLVDEPTSLKDEIEVREVAGGTYLMKEDSHKDVALVYVLTGSLILTQKMIGTNEDNNVYIAHVGDFVGALAVLTGEPSYFSIRTKHFCRIALISKLTFYNLVKDNPRVILNVANLVLRSLSPFVRMVDFALDWIFLEAGRPVYRQDDESDSMFLMLSGRVRSVITHKNGKKEQVAEYGRSDLLGIVEMVTQTKRGTTVIAIRDTEMAKLPEGLFNVIKILYPIIVTRLINLLGMRIIGSWKTQSSNWTNPTPTLDSRPMQLNFSTVAIVAASDDVPLTAFTYELYHCLSLMGPTSRLTSDLVRKTLGSTILDPNNEYRLCSWLAQQEDQHKISLYQCDNTFTMWTQRCIRQADCILIVCLGDKEPVLSNLEREIERVAVRTQKELVLLHHETCGKPHNTISWLNMRAWISWHHHILCPKRMFSRKSIYRINELYSKVCMSEPNIHSDFSRLARWLLGKSVGLVLGGGGARGCAHIGMIKAILEAGIPIDMVGGVSIGSFMGALYCKERNLTTVTQKAREWARKMTQWWRQILDLTYPVTSMFSGREFNATIKSAFGETFIEDLWLPYFNITTNITESNMRIHTHGCLWRYVRSSMSLSGYMPPLCDPIDGHLLLDGGYTNNLPGVVWRYVRASMSYAGVFPPMIDSLDGHLLLDGCYINNLPGTVKARLLGSLKPDVMRARGANHVIAVDVGSVEDQELTNYGDDLSGWWLLWKRWNPFVSPVRVPNLPDIQSRLAYVSCVRQLEEVKTSDYCEYIRPPIDRYKTLQFGSFDEIKDVGYQHGKAYFDGKKRAGLLPLFRRESDLAQDKKQSLGCYTFTDLAQMVCNIRRPFEDCDSSLSEEEYEDDENRGYASEPSVGLIDTTPKYGRPYGSLSLSENEMEGDVDFDLTRHQRKES